MNWYKLDIVRDTLRLDYGAEPAPGVNREHGSNVEVWTRTVGEHVFTTFVNYENDECLLHEEQLLAAAEHLNILPALAFLEKLKARGGLWVGPSPQS